MEKSAIREKSIKGEDWQLVKRKVVWCEIWNVPLCCVSYLLGKGGLEVCGHGHWQDIPLDVCTGVYTGICGTLFASLAGWNDLDTHHWGKGSPRTLTGRRAVLYCKKKRTVYHLSFYLLFFKGTTSHTPCSRPGLSKGYSRRDTIKYLSLIPVGI